MNKINMKAKKNYRRVNEFFRNGLLINKRSNNFSAYKLLYPYLFRIINKDTARKHHEIMKVVQVNDKIKIEGHKYDPSGRYGTRGRRWFRPRNFYEREAPNQKEPQVSLYNNLVIELPPKQLMEYALKQNLLGVRGRNNLRINPNTGEIMLRKNVNKPFPWGANLNCPPRGGIRSLIYWLKEFSVNDADLYKILQMNNVKGRTKMKRNRRQMLKAIMKL